MCIHIESHFLLFLCIFYIIIDVYAVCFQEKLGILQHKAVSYINLDIVVTGPQALEATASPLLHTLIYNVTKMVSSLQTF